MLKEILYFYLNFFVLQYIPSKVQEDTPVRQLLMVESGSEQRDGAALQAPASH